MVRQNKRLKELSKNVKSENVVIFWHQPEVIGKMLALSPNQLPPASKYTLNQKVKNVVLNLLQFLRFSWG